MIVRNSIHGAMCSSITNDMDDGDNGSETDSDEDLEAGEKWLVFLFLFQECL